MAGGKLLHVHGKQIYYITDPYFQEIKDSLSLESDTSLQVQFKRLRANAKYVVWSGTDGKRIKDATIELNDTMVISNTLGLATFKALKVDTLYPYQVIKEGMMAESGTLSLKKDSTINIYLMATGLEYPRDIASMEIYPTPASGYLVVNVVLPSDGNLLITVVDQTGRERKVIKREGFAGENQFKLDLTDLASGISVLIIQHGDRSYRQKFLLQ